MTKQKNNNTHLVQFLHLFTVLLCLLLLMLTSVLLIHIEVPDCLVTFLKETEQSVSGTLYKTQTERTYHPRSRSETECYKNRRSNQKVSWGIRQSHRAAV